MAFSQMAPRFKNNVCFLGCFSKTSVSFESAAKRNTKILQMDPKIDSKWLPNASKIWNARIGIKEKSSEFSSLPKQILETDLSAGSYGVDYPNRFMWGVLTVLIKGFDWNDEAGTSPSLRFLCNLRHFGFRPFKKTMFFCKRMELWHSVRERTQNTRFGLQIPIQFIFGRSREHGAEKISKYLRCLTVLVKGSWLVSRSRHFIVAVSFS